MPNSNINLELLTITVPGFPGRPAPLTKEVAGMIALGNTDIEAFIIRNTQPDVFEKLLRADGRFSEKFLDRYHRNLQREGWCLDRNGEWRKK